MRCPPRRRCGCSRSGPTAFVFSTIAGSADGCNQPRKRLSLPADRVGEHHTLQLTAAADRRTTGRRHRPPLRSDVVVWGIGTSPPLPPGVAASEPDEPASRTVRHWTGGGDQARCARGGTPIDVRLRGQHSDADEPRSSGATRRPSKSDRCDRYLATRSRTWIAAAGTIPLCGKAPQHAHSARSIRRARARERGQAHQQLARRRAAR